MREYNNNISEKANRSLSRRATVVRSQKIMIAIASIIIISIFVLLGSTIHAFASANGVPVNKYYTSVEIEQGDTLWSIADRYMDNMKLDKQDYITEICSINNISEDNIHAGDNILVYYYSTEVK